MEKINLDDILNKDGHTDVASAKRQMKKIQEDIVDIYTSLTSKKKKKIYLRGGIINLLFQLLT